MKRLLCFVLGHRWDYRGMLGLCLRCSKLLGPYSDDGWLKP